MRCYIISQRRSSLTAGARVNFSPDATFALLYISLPRQFSLPVNNQCYLSLIYYMYIYILKKILNLCIKFLKHYEMYLDVISIEDPNYRCETIAIKDANHRRKYVVSPVRIDRGLYSWNEVRTKGDGEGKRIKTASKAEWIYNYISSVLSVENNRLDALSRMADDN